MARVKLRCIMGCPGLKSDYWEKGLLQNNTVNEAMSVLITRVIIKVVISIAAIIVTMWIAIRSFYRVLASATWQGSYEFSLFSSYCYSYESLTLIRLGFLKVVLLRVGDGGDLS